jgi:hypothetical protein
MILDNMLELADGQATTVNAASTNVVDTLAGGDAYSGGMAGLFFVVRVATAPVAVGAPTKIFQLQTADTEDFTGASPVTLVQSNTFLAAGLPINKLITIPVPPGGKRYVRGYHVSTGSGSSSDYFTAGAFDIYITKDAPITRELA